MHVRFYGKRVPEEHFDGRLGRLVVGLNRTRAAVERVTEITAVLHQAMRGQYPLAPVVSKLLEEGVTAPATPRSRAPLNILQHFRPAENEEPEDPNVSGKRLPRRDYTIRQGRRLDIEREERASGIVRDRSFSLQKSTRAMRNRASRHLAEPIVRECFIGLKET